MTDRERFAATVRFGRPDRLPNYEYGAWPQTLRRWHSEGLSETLQWPVGPSGFVNSPSFDNSFGLDRRDRAGLRIDMIPPFEEEILAEDERTITMRRWDGQVTRALKEGALDGIRTSMDQYLDAPVHDARDFKALQFRYQAGAAERWNPTDWDERLKKWRASGSLFLPVPDPVDWDERAEEWRHREWPLALAGSGAWLGLYMQLRSWMGTERLSYAFYDQASLVHEMLDFFTDFVLSLMDKALQTATFDFFNFEEDFSYKSGPLMSPAHFREFFAPRYRRITDRLHKAGIHIIMVDSDGNCEALIPMMLDVGINCIEPLEAAAGMDPVRLRKQYPKDLVLMGGIDKRAVAEGPRAIEQELHSKILPLRDRGGYIPFLDHLFTEDISYPNFLYYLKAKGALL